GDGFGSTVEVSSTSEIKAVGEADNSYDCDDGNASITTNTWYADTDADGFGDPSTWQQACFQPAGYVTDNTDCDDAKADVKPFGTDVAGSGIDANCDGQYTWYKDADGDGFGSTTTVTSTNTLAGPGESTTSDDCDDNNVAINPEVVWYADTDVDGFGDPNTSQQSCLQPTGYVADNTDHNDADATQNPDAIDVAGSGIDANGDGLYTWYEDQDGDGHGSATTVTSANATAGAGESATSGDCDDTDKDVYPGAPALADGKDNDCDGTVDKLMLTATLTDQTRVYGTANLAFTITYTGFAGTDDATAIDTPPTAATTATETSDAGTYAIMASGGVDDAYDFTYVNGTLIITPTTATVTLTDLEHQSDETAKSPTVTTNPDGLNYTITYNGSATAPSAPGSYDVVVTIDAVNYSGETTGVLVINEVLGLEDLKIEGMEVYPNPTADRLNLSWPTAADRSIMLYDGQGRQVRNIHTRDTRYMINLNGLDDGLYRLIVIEGEKKQMMNIVKKR
ncbi:MAG: MBG domain-containing protein, partial [Cyclobacteriaceae bacterium]|nr:MBG domain-containing protein [Cyclobacteriaceae bacterium]